MSRIYEMLIQCIWNMQLTAATLCTSSATYYWSSLPTELYSGWTQTKSRSCKKTFVPTFPFVSVKLQYFQTALFKVKVWLRLTSLVCHCVLVSHLPIWLCWLCPSCQENSGARGENFYAVPDPGIREAHWYHHHHWSRKTPGKTWAQELEDTVTQPCSDCCFSGFFWVKIKNLCTE